MEHNQLTPEERVLLNLYAKSPIADLTDVELADFRYLLDKHQLAEKMRCLAN